VISKTKNKKSSKLPLIISISVLVVLVGSYFLFPAVKSFVDEAWQVLRSDDEKEVEEWVSQFGMLGPLVLILLMVAQMFLFVVPNVLLMMIAIISYGPVWGGLLAWFGVFVASSTGYVIGRKIGTPALDRLVSDETQNKLVEFVQHYGFGAIFLTRLSSFSNDALSFVAGVLEMSYLRYISATLGGIAPLIIVLAIYGRDGKIEKALIWISAVSIILLVIYIIIDKKRKKKKKGQKQKA
jgi:uncharacterized membrane protein YdjX (TVP38/TMEM64 family)